MTTADVQALLDEVDAEIEADAPGFHRRLIQPTSSDYEIIGRLIQQFCTFDLHGRNIMSMLQMADGGVEAVKAPSLTDTNVLEELPKYAAKAGCERASADIISICELFKGSKHHRHNFAHWMARRVPDREVLMLFTMNAKETGRRVQRELPPDHACHALVPLSSMPSLVQHLERANARLHGISKEISLSHQ